MAFAAPETILLIVTIGTGGALAAWLWNLRNKSVLQAEEPDDTCIAYDSIAVTVLRFSESDISGISADDGRSKHHELANAVDGLIEARDHLRRADELEGRSTSAEDESDTLSPGLAFADVHLDNLGADLVVHAQIKELERRVSQMLTTVDASIARVGAASA